MVSPIDPSTNPLKMPTGSPIVATQAILLGISSSSTTMQSANALPSIPSNPFLKGIKFIWNCITRFCIVLCGIFIACKGVTGDNTFLTWLNQSKHHFKDGIGVVLNR